ncbi:neuronal acetylcholine receptor subunit alpha-10-like [Ptychodera flava]|uniref:neuronal acetylcholine receptor subunit alpha-10-like n=1 Tax=Ptychodera flava TaxID=63121 RepID=UPI00396A21D7
MVKLNVMCRLLCVSSLVGMVWPSQMSQDLTNFLLDNYPKYPIRPVKDESTPVIILHRMTPVQIIDLDESNQILTLKSWLEETWIDEYLRWNPRDYEGLSEIQIKTNHIWQPDIVLFSSVTKDLRRHTDSDAIVNCNGTVTALRFYIAEATCEIDATYFPFDEQLCEMKFASWSYHGRYLDMKRHPLTGIDQFINNGEWDLVKMSVERKVEKYICCQSNEFPGLIYTLHLKRRAAFYIMNIIFPSVLLSVLIAVASFLPSDSGERMALCVTTIVSQFVFMTVTTTHMPPTSTKIPHLQRHFFTLIGMGVLSAFMTAMTLNLHYQGPGRKEVPHWLRKLTFHYLARVLCVPVRLPKVSPLAEPKKNRVKFKDAGGANGNDGDLSCAFGRMPNNTDVESRDEHGVDFGSDLDLRVQERRLREWQEVARILDRGYLLTYSLVLSSLMFVYLPCIPLLALDNHEHYPDEMEQDNVTNAFHDTSRFH